MIVVHHPPDVEVRFGYSPLAEAVFSLHVLRRPRHHPIQAPWVRRMRALPGPLRSAIRASDRVLGDAPPDAVVDLRDSGPPTFAAELDRIRSLDPATVTAQFPGADPAAEHERFCRLMADYWDQVFVHEWERVEPHLAAAAWRARSLVERGGLHALLGTMSPRVTPDGRSSFSVWCAKEEFDRLDGEVTWSEAGLAWLTPSLFSWPHHWLAHSADGPGVMAFPVHTTGTPAREATPPEDLVRVLRACGDDVRLKVLRLVGERPRTTQELAPLMQLSPSGLSKHLRMLADAGLVETRREGYYVLYQLREDRIGPLADSLRSYLGVSREDELPAATA